MRFLLLLLLSPVIASGQVRSQFAGEGAPTGYCAQSRYLNTLDGSISICDDATNTWGVAVATKLVTSTTTVNGQPLSANVTVTAGDVGLGNVSNTSDANKPVSTAQQTALNLKANTSSLAPSATTDTTNAANISSGTLPATRLPTTITVTGSFGYATGAGGSVTQLTSKTTAVTLNTITGSITTHNAALAAAAEVSFTVTNSQVAATDVPVLAIRSGGTAGSYFVTVGSVSAGSFTVTLGNVSTGSLSQAVVISFVIIKGVTN